MAKCDACGADIAEEVERFTARMLTSLDDARRVRLSETYGGKLPERLCAACCLPTITMLNSAGRVA